jgi:hypothetical protein
MCIYYEFEKVEGEPHAYTSITNRFGQLGHDVNSAVLRNVLHF